MSQEAKAPPAGRALRWVLIVSLAVNLAVAGLALGAFLRGGPGPRDMGRNLGFGPYDAALQSGDRESLRAAMRARMGDLGRARTEAQADMQAVLAALRADPFVPEALERALGDQNAHLAARMRLGSDVMRDFLAGLSPQDRKAFADRLEARMKHGRAAGDHPPPPAD